MTSQRIRNCSDGFPQPVSFAMTVSTRNLCATGHAGIRNFAWRRCATGVGGRCRAAGITPYLFHEIRPCPVAKRQPPINDPVRFEWNEVIKVAHYYLSVDALTRPMQVCEGPTLYGESGRN